MGIENSIFNDIHKMIECKTLLRNSLTLLSMDYIAYVRQHQELLGNKNDVIRCIERAVGVLDSSINDIIYQVTVPLQNNCDCVKKDCISDLKSLANYEANL